MLRAVDIASWEAGIDVAALDCDIVIVKATGGTSYVNPYWREWAQAALDSGKLLGLYHYAMEYGIYNDAAAEARFFLDETADFKGRFVPVLDFEADAQGLPIFWPHEWLDYVASETGSTPFFYVYASYLNSRDHSELTDYPLWMASYLNKHDGAGWVEDPENRWATGDWDDMMMYQYTSTGRIGGYGGPLDLSVFYGDRKDWKRLEGGRMGTAQGLIDVAYGYLGTTEDDPRFAELIEYYNDNTDGYDMRMWDEWCACFASVCSLKSGNEEATGTSVNCAVFRNIWREKGIFRERWETPETGWLIEYDWQSDSIPDHIGIVVDCDGDTIHVIEGNMNEVCAERWIPVGSWSISCFGAPEYQDEEIEEEEKVQGVNITQKGDEVRRMYKSGDHFYTASREEVDIATNAGYAYEGAAWKSPAPEIPVYSLYNGEDHFYTADFAEAQAAQEGGYKPEGVRFCAARDGQPVYRLYSGGDHFYTTDEGERNSLVAAGWSDEGVAFHV